MDLSVIIVSYNVRHFLQQCLISAIRASVKITSEIIVVDNNSADGSCSMVSSDFPGVRLIRNKFNAGFSSACNQAIRISGGRYVLLLNPDTVVEESTFTDCIRFMDEHPEAGAMGVQMIDGNGRLLPESKRAFPTPLTAFFKMTGISRLFPGSRFFNRYYLGHLDSSETTEADILSGAFMFIRKSALDKTGLLDEEFFMYGEDIDLSYRLVKAGYKNYYFPGARIIHYKGKSTGKGNINHLLHFYRAMLIFSSKHFSGKGYGFLRLMINIAVYFWASVAIFKKMAIRYFLPSIDTIILVLVYLLFIPFWEKVKFGGNYHYPEYFHWLVTSSCTLISLFSVCLSGGYRIPSRIYRVFKGLVIGSAVSLALYALLPQDLRFSRAVLLFGGIISVAAVTIARLLLSITGSRLVENPFAGSGRIAIVSDESGYGAIVSLAGKPDNSSVVAGRISIRTDDLGNEVLGSLDQMDEIVRINRISEVIFSTRELSAAQIITSMKILSGLNVSIRIAPAGEKILIGSKSIHPDITERILNTDNGT